MAERVAVHVLTHDSGPFLRPCLDGIRQQTRRPDAVRFIDCASTDGTADRLRTVCRRQPGIDFLPLAANRGYAGGHNAGLAAGDEELVLLLNPDVRLEARFIEEAVAVMNQHPQAGAVSGRLVRGDLHLDEVPGPLIDSTGLVMTRTQRHRDRGAGQIDSGQFDQATEIFGASGAAPLYRRKMLEDIAIDGEIFDENFFAYREDVDLAWRARLMGWSAWYAPRARAVHRRRLRPGSRRRAPAFINRHSVKNRFLLRMKNQTWSNLGRTWPGIGTDMLLIGWLLVAERSSLGGLAEAFAARRATWEKRRQIMARRRVRGWDVDRWFVSGHAD
ncbi:MAG: glycosyltransferase family 2 protein [Acidobacteriota bacterium]